MTCRDTITRRRAKGLWTGRFWIELGHADSVRQEWRPARPGLGSGYKSRGLAPRDEGTASTSGLKPYWGKPAVRNFREGRGNGAASAAIAPLLYSTVIVDKSGEKRTSASSVEPKADCGLRKRRGEGAQVAMHISGARVRWIALAAGRAQHVALDVARAKRDSER